MPFGMGTVRAIGKKLMTNKFETITNAGFGYMSYNDARDEGESIEGSLMSAVADTAIPYAIGFLPYVGLQVATGLGKAAVSFAETSSEFGRSIARSANQPFGTAAFQDSEQFATMRQAGMALMGQSKYNMQQTLLGNEARNMHR